jgi:hypothetical protein
VKNLADVQPVSETVATDVVTETVDNGVPISDSVKVAELTAKVATPEKVKIIEQAKKAAKTLKSLFPNFDIVIHDTVDSYNAAMSRMNSEQNTRGNFSYQQNADGTHSGRININLQNANSRTVAHEVAHAVLLKAFGDNPTVFKNFKNKLSAILNSSKNTELNKFAEMYDKDVSYEEYLVELTAMLANNEASIEPTVLQKIAALINTFVSKLTNGMVQPFNDTASAKDVIDFFNAISAAIKSGTELNLEGNKLTDSVSRSQNQPLTSASIIKSLSKVSNLENILSKIKTFTIDDLKDFYHASANKRDGRLTANTAPQFGTGIYFSTNKDTVTDEFGDNVTNVALNLDKPVFTNTKEWYNVVELAIKLADEDYGKKNNLTLDEDETHHKYDSSDLSEIDEISAKFISEAAKQLGYDAIIDKNGQYQNEISVIDESKIIYEEDLPKFISEAYIKAKESGSNPDLVNAVDKLISNTQEPKTVNKSQLDDNVINTIIERGRNQGVSDATLRAVLKRQGISDTQIGKYLGNMNPAPKKVVVNEMSALKDQLRLEAKAAREAKADVNTFRKMIGKVIAAMETTGKITTKQAQQLISKLSNLNVDNVAHVEKFFQYAEKVFADAEYGQKMSTARKNISQLKKLAKNNTKDINLRMLARQFLDIDPSMVENIDEYNAIAEQIRESLVGSKANTKQGNVNQANMVSIEKTMDYVWREMALQNEAKRVQAAEEMKALMDIDPDGLTYDQLQELLAQEEEISAKLKEKIREQIKTMFDRYSSTINHMINESEDPFTYERLSFTDSEKKTIRAFMDMDLSLLSTKEALQAVDALNNFIVNRSTAGMDALVGAYTGRKNVKELVDKGIIAKTLKLYWSKILGAVSGEQFTNISLLYEKMWKGFERGGAVEKAMGVRDFLNGCAKALNTSNKMVSEYVEKFYSQKANGEAFNTAYNDIERGLTATMARTVWGTEAQKQAVFNRRKSFIEESIKRMREDGSKREQEKAVLYQKAYDKLLANSNNLDEVKNAADPVNREAVEFWIDKWAGLYDKFADLSERVYNKILERDANFTPIRYTQLDEYEKVEELSNDTSAFHSNNGTVYKKEAGSFMQTVDHENLPKGRYLDLSFDKVNANSMHDALTDMETAQSIRQIEAFENSPDLKKLVPDSDNRKMLKRRVANLIRAERGKMSFDNNDLNKMAKVINGLAMVSTNMALGGITQIPKQMLTAMTNTFVNSGLKLDIAAGFDPKKMAFVDKSGHSIANRGIKSHADVEHINKLLDLAAKSKGEKAAKAIGQIGEKYMKYFLEHPDVFAAKVSWITFYEQSLKNQNINPAGFEDRPLNEKAADYATRMVDRNLNDSDAHKQGMLFTNNNPGLKMALKTILPLASFRLNATARLNSDLITFTSKTATVEDKKIAAKSAAAGLTELAIFGAMTTAISYGLLRLTRNLMGRKDGDDEKEKELDNAKKGAYTRLTGDLFSPLPFLDPVVTAGINGMIDELQDLKGVPEKDRFALYDNMDKTIWDQLGVFSIAPKRAYQFLQASNMVRTGEYTDKYKKVHKLTEEDRKFLRDNILPAAFIDAWGVAPTEVDAIVRNSIKVAQKGASDAKKADKDEKKQSKLDRLQGYDTESEMKRYDPALYEETFGKNSPNYEAEQAQRDAEKEANREARKAEDEARGYKKPERETKKRNSRW